ncbi:hypothetical protein Q3G72_012880 [Acer saccharum]|nr:hypothetical protein Q3G72_012880 [Acer saccharum]
MVVLPCDCVTASKLLQRFEGCHLEFLVSDLSIHVEFINDKVPIFELLREQQLNAMCLQLKPVLYPGETYIVRKDDPVDEMLFIMRGELLSWGSNGRDRNLSEAEYLTEFCGEELSSWAIDPQSLPDQRPLSTSTIKTLTEVEAFALMADDLKEVFTKFKL